MNRMIPVAIVAAMAVPATPVFAQAMTGSAYVMKAGAGDLYEKQSSQLVLQSTGNADLKQFANQMITDHSKSTADVKAAAMKAHMKVGTPHLNAMQTSNIAKLRAAHGAARDTMYVSQQKVAHQQALMLHQGYADNGKVASLKMVASNIAPVVQSHIDMLKSM